MKIARTTFTIAPGPSTVVGSMSPISLRIRRVSTRGASRAMPNNNTARPTPMRINAPNSALVSSEVARVPTVTTLKTPPTVSAPPYVS